ncbi:cobalt-precorrin-6A reductase [Paracoccus sp. MBLB3053]|uniref:Cobalt-precorrin-6A reductase n=1 Tax=Paracoccus aurantius TaxID=3073814 RepID=A0ABU2HT67_9RHOB|nr:cobalt-precorrin-6A reductase [Paracoccus sp. MBLB3053]MDS9468243.1 cobalt-precorrin-6A reductase [Paracoccus sp. MBLB3053]
MRPNVLILAGTAEASALARRLAAEGISGKVSLAGRVETPLAQPLPMRIGGFGGIDGLVAHLRAKRVSHVIDATHPFAAQMSRHAHAACGTLGIPLLRLTRPEWQHIDGDHWINVPDMPAAVAALDRAPMRVMLAVGRMHLAEFAVCPQHYYLLRLVDPPNSTLPLPHCHVILGRGPFDLEADRDLMRKYDINLIVSKNSGGTGAYAKIAAARSLQLPVLMIDRPAKPDVTEVHDVGMVIDWLHADADLGV